MWWAPLVWLLVRILEPIADDLVVGLLKKKVPNLPKESALAVPDLLNAVVDHLAAQVSPAGAVSALSNINQAVNGVTNNTPNPGGETKGLQ